MSFTLLFTPPSLLSVIQASPTIWVTYRSGVYDVTNFVKSHPGGERILLAAGSSVDPFWAMYAAHKEQNVYEVKSSLCK